MTLPGDTERRGGSSASRRLVYFLLLAVLSSCGYVIAGCPNPKPMGPSAWLSAVSPDEEKSARVLRSGGRYAIEVRRFTDWQRHQRLPERPAIWQSKGVPVRYLFWLDDQTLEALVLESDRSRFHSIQSRSVEGVRVVTRAIPSTAMNTVLDSERLPELVVAPLNDD